MAGKICERCAAEFTRKGKMTDKQWEGRRFCSKKCSATKTDLDVADICERYRNLESSTEIAQSIGISATHVRRILKSHGEQIRCPSENKKLCASKPEFREKIRQKSIGRKLSEAAKAKLRARVGPINHNWGGGTTITSQGYRIYTPSSANGERAGRLYHRVVAEEAFNRKLLTENHVHHIDGNKLNNEPDNLVILTASEHAKIHNLGKS